MSAFSTYYQEDLEKFLRTIVPPGDNYISINEVKDVNSDLKKYDYIFLPNTFSYLDDVQDFLKLLGSKVSSDAKIIVIYFNFLWKPLLDLASFLKLRVQDPREPNWLSSDDITNLFILQDYYEVKKGRRFLIPLNLWFFSSFINKYISRLPLVNSLCLNAYQVFRKKKDTQSYSVSIVIPARNEAGNIKGILKSIPNFTENIEVIFVEGHSKDKTFEIIKNEIRDNLGPIKASLIKQKGIGKGNAVRTGLKRAKNQILMILDADLTVRPKDLEKFYFALTNGYCDFANGSRLIYPLENESMRTLNYFGNKMFSIAFTFLLGQKIKDTLCGTKALFRKDYLRISVNRKYFGNFDPFGDFDLLFGASRLNLKIMDIPVRYHERSYGRTNISRLQHGLLLLRMVIFAAGKLKFT